MGSKGRMPPPPHMRRPLPPGHGLLHPEQVPPVMHPHPGPFSPFDMLPPPQVMEQKLATQHVEMQRLATENQRLAATHGTLRQELAAAQHELQMLHLQIGTVKAEREQQIRGMLEKIGKMEAELQTAEPIKHELQQARAEAQSLVVSREELIGKAQQLNQELQRVHADVQQIPALITELEHLRQEYQHCRATFDYEKKLYNDHLESLQVMEKNYVSMTREVEKLRAELTNTANVDRRSSGPYGGTSGTNESEPSTFPVGQNAYEDGYAVMQGRGPIPGAGGAVAAAAAATAGAQPGPVSAGAVYDASRGGPGYNTSSGPTYDPQRLTGYDAFRGTTYDSKRGQVFDPQRTGYDPQRALAYDPSRTAGYDAQSRGVAGPHGHAPAANNMPYGSATPPTRGGAGYEAQPRGVNPAVRR
ncbi:hypothetical protein HN51_067964 [Arachis hypogaea]|uniref:protein FLX-like 2 n=1 Tax=Arachis ipaensis TaxID=130454 RepID=UPI0007AF4189|nr:protein FLX-like 2 [Arachis ipaensis]XP_016194491.1 protein FLX-like 2 [Arachis ipaensis]XP_020977797.1 protein FLX-like 2 [Arachis ipaensis]XP_025650186.1 protein FLX-like 2 [Arachis hypogaea]QHO09469.1 Protein FLX-like [Arachis hypogaea]